MVGDRPGFRPVHPGVIVKRNIDALDLTIEAFADHIGTSRQNVHAIIRGDRAVTPEMAARLGRAFKTSSQFWLNMQSNHDVWVPEREASILKIRPFKWPLANAFRKRGATSSKPAAGSTALEKGHRRKA
jgi:addiction module HigA family antidote